ncbi:hypothetical protein S83_061806 [Arachis hypogaea]
MEVDRSNQECGGGNPSKNGKEPLEQEDNLRVESSKEGNKEIDGSNQDPKDKKRNNLFPKEENPFGPWMLVKRNQRRYKPKMEDSHMEKKERFQSSRFQALEGINSEDYVEENQSNYYGKQEYYANSNKETKEGKEKSNQHPDLIPKNLGHQKNQQKSKAPPSQVKGRPIEISKKQQTIQSQPKQSNKIDLVNASSQVTDPSTSNARRVQNEKNKNDHSDYW